MGASYDGLLQTEQRFSLSKVRFGIAWSCKRRIAVDTAPPPKAEYALLVEQVEEAQVMLQIFGGLESCAHALFCRVCWVMTAGRNWARVSSVVPCGAAMR